MGGINILDDIINLWKDKILFECKKIQNKEELLGIEINHYYDGKSIMLSVLIIFFKEDKELISKGESRKEYIELLDNDNINYILENNSEIDIDKKNEITKLLAKDLYKILEKINWSTMGISAKEFYIDLLLNYD